MTSSVAELDVAHVVDFLVMRVLSQRLKMP